jgi:hypothetical protein
LLDSFAYGPALSLIRAVLAEPEVSS